MTENPKAGRFQGKTALITGAARGIGAAVAHRLASEGARIAACDLDQAGVVALADAIKAAGGQAITGCFDSRDPAACDAFASQAAAAFGSVDLAVPCAGIARAARAEEMTPETWGDVIGVNLTGVFHTCQAAGRHMLRQGRGAIVTIASITAKGGQAGRANYAASKWGIVGLTKTLAVEWGHRGVRVNAVAPNGVDTPMVRDGLPAEFLEDVMLDRTPLGRLATPEEVAGSVAFLLSDDAAYVNGAVLEVDGGVTAGFMTHRHGADLARKAGGPNDDRSNK